MLSGPGAAVLAPAPAAVVLAHALSVGKVGRFIDTTNTTGYNIVPGLLTVAQCRIQTISCSQCNGMIWFAFMQ